MEVLDPEAEGLVLRGRQCSPLGGEIVVRVSCLATVQAQPLLQATVAGVTHLHGFRLILGCLGAAVSSKGG